MASMAVFDEEVRSPDAFISSALKLATTLPEAKDCTTVSFPFLARPSTRVPGALLYSPLAYSLERHSLAYKPKPVNAVAGLRAKVAEVADNAARAGEALVRETFEAAVNHLLGTLHTLAEFGRLLRIPVPILEEGSEKDSWRNFVRGKNFAAVLPGDSVVELVVAQGIFQFLNIYNTLLIVRLVLTWFPNPPSFLMSPLSTLCDPYLNLFRGIIPPLGGTLDFSPILAFLVLNVFTNSAAAIPCELPGEGSRKKQPFRRPVRQAARNADVSAVEGKSSK